MQEPKITFEYGTPYLTSCYGGVEHFQDCDEDAAWTEKIDGEQAALYCNRCKHEVETYISNQPL